MREAGGRQKGRLIVRAYRATCAVSGKSYIGICVRSISERFGKHLYSVKHGSQTFFHKAIGKYGVEAFTIEWIASAASWAQGCELEKVLIRQERTRAPKGYNATDGGDGSSGVVERSGTWRSAMATYFAGRIFTDEYRANLSAGIRASMTDERRAKSSATGKRTMSDPQKVSHIVAARDTPEWRRKLSETAKARGISAETRAKMNAAAVGRPWSEKRRANYKPVWLGRHHTEESKAKMAAAATGVKHTPESRAKMSLAKTGVVDTSETRAKKSQAARIAWQRRKATDQTQPVQSME